MKKTFFLIIICNIIYTFGFTQISIDYTDFAPIGRNFIMAVDEFSPREKVTIENFGGDSWIFTDLEIDDYDTIRHLAAEKTRYGDFFDSSNYVQYFGFYEIDYYHLDEQRLVKVGTISDYLDLGAPSLVPFQEHILRYEFPLEYGKTFSDTAYQKFKTPFPIVEGIDSIKADIFLTENVEFDAFGSITTPIGTFESLREKQTLHKKVKAYQYTIYGWTPAPKFDKNFTQTIYRWYVKGEEIPVVIVEVNEKGYVTKVKYKYEEEMKLTFDTKHVACRGGKNGKIDLTVRGGIPDYTYVWTNGDTIEDPIKLSANTYSVTVTDNHGKTATGGFSVSEPQDSLIMDITINQISCYGKRDGSLSVEAVGGIPPYFIIWTTDSVGNSISNLDEGKYGVIVRDDNRCFIWDTVEIVAPKEPLTVDIEETPVKCKNGNDGKLEAFGYGGTAPYTYFWSNSDTAKIANNLKAGEYSVIVTDNHGCTKEKTKKLTEPATPIEITLNTYDVNCNGGSDGYINTVIKGGGTPYKYLWSNGSEDKNIERLSQGVYKLTVTDDNGCVISETTEIKAPEDSLIIEFTKNNVDCFGKRTGSIYLNVSGGTPDYFYYWEHGEIKNSAEELFAGTYFVEVADSRGCVSKKSFTINQPEEPLIIQSSPKNITCVGEQDGAIDIFVSGGTSPYKYKWSNGSDEEDLFGLKSGTYTVKVTDAKDCEKEKTFVVEEPTEKLEVEINITPISAENRNDAKISLKVAGGVEPYYYKWSTEAETNYIDRLKPGTYTVEIIDEFGCTLNQSITIEQYK